MLTSALEVNGVNGERLIQAYRPHDTELDVAPCVVFKVWAIGKGDVRRILKGNEYVGAQTYVLLDALSQENCYHFITFRKCLQVKKLTVSKINKTRQSSGGGLWVPSDESCICNMHYEDFEGPSRWKINLVPRYFKRPHEFDHERSVERRVLVRNVLEPVDQASGSSEDVPSTKKSLMCDATTQCNDPLVEEVCSLKEKDSKLTGEIHHLQTTLQGLASSQLFMYTGLNAHEFQCLVSWLTGTSLGRRSRSPDDPATLSEITYGTNEDKTESDPR